MVFSSTDLLLNTYKNLILTPIYYNSVCNFTSNPNHMTTLANWQLKCHRNCQTSAVEDLEAPVVQTALLLVVVALQAFSCFHNEPVQKNPR